MGDDNGNWVVPSKGNYPASTAAIRSFLLKLMDISTSQKIQVFPEGLEKLGLNDSGKQSGHGVITLSYGDKEAAKVYLGSLRNRKGQGMEEQATLSGQYVKYSFSDQVFMLPLSINLQIEEKNWLKTELFSIPSSEIYSFESVAILPNGDIGKQDFGILRQDEISSSSAPKFGLTLPAPAGKEIQTTVVNQIVSGLENFNFSNVYRDSDELVKGVVFSKGAVFSLLNGLQYQVRVGKKDAQTLIKISSVLSKEVQSKVQEIEKKITEGTSQVDGKQNETKVEPKKIEYANDSSITLENQKLSGWVYEIPDFVASRFSKVPTDFFKDIAVPPVPKEK